jgi:hypothetical protein
MSEKSTEKHTNAVKSIWQKRRGKRGTAVKRPQRCLKLMMRLWGIKNLRHGQLDLAPVAFLEFQ